MVFDSSRPAAAGTATISGQVYEAGLGGEPPIPGAIIEVTAMDGSKQTAQTADDGWYSVPARIGPVTIVAARQGYEPKTIRFTLDGDTVLNFSLNPLARERKRTPPERSRIRSRVSSP